MNYLAHLYLSCDDKDLLLGNYLADHIKNKEVSQYSEAIQKGIQLHRSIDSFTDNHLLVKQSSQRLHATQGKYAPVAVDILYDYLLATHWQRYSELSLQDFSNNTYGILKENIDVLPAKLATKTRSMIQHNWLVQYGKTEGLQFTLSKMDERTKFPSNFVNAFGVLQENIEEFSSEFNTFFPELKQHVSLFCGC